MFKQKTKMSEKYELKIKVIEELKKTDIMGFIIDEVDDSLDYLNKYKIKNILDNMELFIEELKKVNQSYINSL